LPQSGILTLEILHLTSAGIADIIPGQPFLAGLHEILQPGIVSAWLNAFPTAQVSNGCIPPKALQHDANLFFSGELAAGHMFDTLDELPGLFTSGFSLPEVVCNLLHHGLLLPLTDNLLIYQYRSKPLSVH